MQRKKMFLVVCLSALLAGSAEGQNILPEKAKMIPVRLVWGRESFLFPVVPAWEVSGSGKTGWGSFLPVKGAGNGVAGSRAFGADAGRTGGWAVWAMSGFRVEQGVSDVHGGMGLREGQGVSGVWGGTAFRIEQRGSGNWGGMGLREGQTGSDVWGGTAFRIEQRGSGNWGGMGLREGPAGWGVPGGVELAFNQGSNGYGGVIPADRVVTHFGFFCKRELELEKTIRLPVRFRLGSLEYCNRLEGK